MTSRWSIAAAIAAALSLAACGDDTATEADQPTATPPVATAPLATEPAAATAPAAAVAPEAAAPAPVAAATPEAAPAAAEAVAPAAAPPPAEPTPAPVTPLAPEPAASAATPAAASEDLLARIRAASPAAGEALAAQCGICHTFAAGEGTRVGPNLYDIVAAPIAREPTFTYSPALIGLAATGGTWTFALLDAFLANPSEAVPGTRMGFGGIADPADRAAVLAYLRSLSDSPEPVGGPREEGRAEAIAAGLAPIAFTNEQVAAGRDFSNRYCTRCHAANYRGLVDMREFGEAPAIVGPRFEARWFGRSVADLFALFANDPRTDYHGGLPVERTITVISFLAERNGMVAGPVPLPVDPAALQPIGFYQ